MSCPCGSEQPYEGCCGVFHSKSAHPHTAEQLMRSRYAAYVRHDIGYLAATHDPERRHEFDILAASQWAKSVDWRRLDILRTERGGQDEQTGMVEFTAWFLSDDTLTCHHEVSDFRRLEDGRWVYVDGIGKSANAIMSRLKRGAPCPCGSGRKYKVCHGR